ncbi:MAG: cytochrome c-type biogenesis protein [Litoreibacter sp.]
MKRFLTLVMLILAVPVWAVEPDEVLDDPVLEERARIISADVRCVVCQNEPIDTSHAGVARDLRLLIRERLVAGDTDQEVFDYLVARYGDYVLFRPPFKPSTYALWIAPFALIGIGGISVGYVLMRKPKRKALELSAADEAEIDRLLKDDK